MLRTLLLLPLLVPGSAACDARAPAGNAQVHGLVSAEASTRPLPALTGRVVDGAGLLDAVAEAELAARLAALEKETTDQVVVVTTGSLDGERIEDFGLRVGNGWGIGRKNVDNGALLIVAPSDRQVRIEVGKGLEGLLTDERAQRILNERVIPACREGHCGEAIANGVEAISEVLRSDRKRPQPKRGDA